MVYEILCIVLLILVILLIWIWINLYKKNKVLEHENYVKYQIFIDISSRIEYSDRKLKEIDIQGHFESDDEVGFFFKQLKDIQKILSSYNLLFNETTNS